MTIKQKVNALLNELNIGIYEKEEVIALALLASVAGENVFLLGPPGVAKALISQRITHVYQSGHIFEYLMNRFSSIDEIFGPVSIKKFSDEDIYERLSAAYLPAASVVFFDEIWRAGHSVQNALHKVLNKRVFHNGTQDIKLSLKALIAASRELPGNGEGLEPLWDTFLVRFKVESIQEEQHFDEMLAMPVHSQADPVKEEHKITDKEYETWAEQINTITIPKNILNVIHSIREAIQQYNQKEEHIEHQIYVSDQRWHKIIGLLRTSAFLNNRASVDPADCFLIKHCIWNEQEHINHIDQFVKEAIEKHGYSGLFDFTEIKQEISAFHTEVSKTTSIITKVTVVETVYGDYCEILNPPVFAHLIKQSDFQNLTDETRRITLYYWNNTYKQVQSAFRSSFASGFSLLLPKPGQVMLGACLIRKGNSEFSIILDDTEYQLKTVIAEKEEQIITKPRPKVRNAWDERAAALMQQIKAMKDQIEHYQNKDKDSEHIRINLFVKPELTAAAELQLAPIRQEIENMETEIREIQNRYKTARSKKP